MRFMGASSACGGGCVTGTLRAGAPFGVRRRDTAEAKIALSAGWTNADAHGKNLALLWPPGWC